MLPKQMFNMWWLTMLVLSGRLADCFWHHAFFSDSAGVVDSPDEHHHVHGSQFSRREGWKRNLWFVSFSTHHRFYTIADDMPNSTTSRQKYEWIVYEVLEDDIWIVRLPRHFWFACFLKSLYTRWLRACIGWSWFVAVQCHYGAVALWPSVPFERWPLFNIHVFFAGSVW